MEEHSLILIRGLPGAGKSRLARLLSEDGKYPVYSVDDYFTNAETGEYIFDHASNYLAYEHCEKRTKQSMQEKCLKIFLDNTFTMDWEMEPYFKLASEFGYTVYVFTVENRHGGQNTHGISKDSLEKMASKYSVKLLA